MLRLDGQEGSDEMIQVFKEAQPQLQELSRNLKLRIKGLSTFGQRVLYAKAITEPHEVFWQFVRYVCLLLVSSDLKIVLWWVNISLDFRPLVRFQTDVGEY